MIALAKKGVGGFQARISKDLAVSTRVNVRVLAEIVDLIQNDAVDIVVCVVLGHVCNSHRDRSLDGQNPFRHTHGGQEANNGPTKHTRKKHFALPLLISLLQHLVLAKLKRLKFN